MPEHGHLGVIRLVALAQSGFRCMPKMLDPSFAWAKVTSCAKPRTAVTTDLKKWLPAPISYVCSQFGSHSMGMAMEHFSIGLLSWGLAVLLAAAVLINYLVRKAGAWYKGEDPPKDKIMVGVALAAVVGFAFGSFFQPNWDQLTECTGNGQTVGQCLFPTA